MSEYLDIDTTYDPECADPFSWSDMVLVSGSTRLIGADGTVDVSVTANDEITVTDGVNPDVILSL
jgi:hypothetical protein